MDIAKPPLGGLDLFNLYVALSQSSGCEIIQLLHDFDDQMFLKTHKPDGETTVYEKQRRHLCQAIPFEF